MEVLYERCCGLDIHKETVVVSLRLVIDGKGILRDTNALRLVVRRWGSLRHSFARECTNESDERRECLGGDQLLFQAQR